MQKASQPQRRNTIVSAITPSPAAVRRTPADQEQKRWVSCTIGSVTILGSTNNDLHWICTWDHEITRGPRGWQEHGAMPATVYLAWHVCPIPRVWPSYGLSHCHQPPKIRPNYHPVTTPAPCCNTPGIWVDRAVVDQRPGGHLGAEVSYDTKPGECSPIAPSCGQSISGGSCFKISCNQYKLGVYPVYPWYVAPGGFNVSERSLDVADKHPRLSEAGMEPKICLQLFTPPGNTIGCSPATIAQRPSYRTIALAGRDLE